MRRHWLALGIVTGMTACGPAPSSGPDGPSARPGGKADWYGDDDRRELFDPDNDPRAVEWARSAAVFVNATRVLPAGPGQSRISSPTLAARMNVCDTEPFASQPSAGNCSAFLVAPDVVATAAHCTCTGQVVVFDYGYASATDDPTHVSDEDVYRCLDAIAWGGFEPGAPDYALMLLDRPVVGRAPLPVRRERPASLDGPLTLIGGPLGVPLKIDAGGALVSVDGDTFTTTFDSYEGQSGAAVLSDDGVVEGLHFAGATDLLETEDGCLTSVACAQVESFGEDCSGSKELFADAFAADVP
jgi:hypothetical protein